MTQKVVHITSAHPRDDIRIYVKECRTLAKKYDVSLIVADGEPNEIRGQVNIVGTTKLAGRIARFLTSSWKLIHLARQSNADIYHFHDPEMMPCALRLNSSGKKVIFDVHEDYAGQAFTKSYIPSYVASFASKATLAVETYALSRLDALIAATPAIAEKLSKINPNVYLVNNYPIVDELRFERVQEPDDIYVCYIGAIGEPRGIVQLVDAMALTCKPVRLKLAGRMSRPLENCLKHRKGWARVDYLGSISRPAVARLLAGARAGVVTFLPAPNHIDSQPNKLFEYMSAGVPVIASDFQRWRDIVTAEDCGLCVDPENPRSIADAIDRLCQDSAHAEMMGVNGLNAVERKYNWAVESEKLITCYEELARRSTS